jgi:hypothetical protein
MHCTRPTFYGALSLKEQSVVGRHVDPLGHIVLILNQPVFVLTAICLYRQIGLVIILSKTINSTSCN